MKLSKLAVIFGALMILNGALQASTTYNYSFGGLGGDLGSNTHVFSNTSGPNPNVTATGYANLNNNQGIQAVNLYSKGSGAWPIPPDESGLGLVNDRSGDNEITAGSFVYLDLNNLDKLVLNSLDIYMESTTDGEGWEIWGSNTAPTSGHFFSAPNSGVLTGKNEGEVNLDSLLKDRYIFITSDCGNVLLGGLTASVDAPEPASVGLIGLSLGIAYFAFRVRSRTQAQKV